MEILLVVFLCVLAGSEVTSEPTVTRVEEGSDVILPCSLSSKENITSQVFDWKKDGKTEVFFYDAGIHYNNGYEGQDQQFTGRVDYFKDELTSGNASIIITNTKVADSGDYTCLFPKLQPSQIFHIQLVVEPTVIRVEEGSDVTLNCTLSTKEDITSQKFVWKKGGHQVFKYDAGDHSNVINTFQDQQFKGRVQHFPDQLKSGDASITINNTKVTDSGDYTCKFPDLQPNQTFHIQLVVYGDLKDRTGENIPGAAPKPSFKRHRSNNSGEALLQCETHGNPQPELLWQDSAGNILKAEEPQVSKRGDQFYVTLQIAVNKTGDYRCVATQDEICHQIYEETYVEINEKENTGFSGGEVAGIVSGILLPVVAIVIAVGLAVLKKMGYTRKKDRGDVV